MACSRVVCDVERAEPGFDFLLMEMDVVERVSSGVE